MYREEPVKREFPDPCPPEAEREVQNKNCQCDDPQVMHGLNTVRLLQAVREFEIYIFYEHRRQKGVS